VRAPLRIVLAAAGAAGLGWILWAPVARLYLVPRRQLVSDIERLRGTVATYGEERQELPRLAARLGAYADRTLGGDLESVDHALRARLNRIGEEIGLSDLSVGTGRSRALESPARAGLTGPLREELDAIELEGFASGQGSLEQTLRLVHRLQEEPWLKLIDEVRLQPREQGKRYAVTLRLRTLLLPGRAPRPAGDWAYDPAGFAPFEQALLARDPFALPPPRPAAEAPHAAVTPPRFPYERWVLTGVAAGPQGAEAWLRETATGASRRLSIGERLEAMELLAASGEVAEFSLDGRRYRVTVGGNLPGP
jgi:hypothetical protein